MHYVGLVTRLSRKMFARQARGPEFQLLNTHITEEHSGTCLQSQHRGERRMPEAWWPPSCTELLMPSQ